MLCWPVPDLGSRCLLLLVSLLYDQLAATQPVARLVQRCSNLSTWPAQLLPVMASCLLAILSACPVHDTWPNKLPEHLYISQFQGAGLVHVQPLTHPGWPWWQLAICPSTRAHNDAQMMHSAYPLSKTCSFWYCSSWPWVLAHDQTTGFSNAMENKKRIKLVLISNTNNRCMKSWCPSWVLHSRQKNRFYHQVLETFPVSLHFTMMLIMWDVNTLKVLWW